MSDDDEFETAFPADDPERCVAVVCGVCEKQYTTPKRCTRPGWICPTCERVGENKPSMPEPEPEPEPEVDDEPGDE